jgi:hypothetical protein
MAAHGGSSGGDVELQALLDDVVVPWMAEQLHQWNPRLPQSP